MEGDAAEELRLPADALKRFRYLNKLRLHGHPGHRRRVPTSSWCSHAMDAVNIDKKAQARARRRSPCLCPAACQNAES